MEGTGARNGCSVRARERDEITVAFVALLHERIETDEKWEVWYEVEMLRRWTHRPSLRSSLPSAVPNTSSLLGT